MTDTVPNTYFRDVLACWEQCGHDTRALLAGTRLRLADLEDINGQVPLEDFRRLMANTAIGRDTAGFPLRLGQQLTPNAHGALGLAFLSSKTVDNALTVLEKYASIQTNLLKVSVERGRHIVHVHLAEHRPLGIAHQPVVELGLSTLWFALRFLSGGQLSLAALTLSYAEPAHRDLYDDIFRCPVTFSGASNHLSLTPASLDLPLLLANPQAMQRAIADCDAQLQSMDHRETLTHRIQRRLLRSPGQFPDLARLAAEFAMSERNLRRKLEAEGHSFQGLLNETRRLLAERYLRDTHHSINDIAWLLGYQDPSNFGNAFKRWHGVSPREFRAAGKSSQADALT